MRGTLRALMGLVIAATLLLAGQTPSTSWSAAPLPLPPTVPPLSPLPPAPLPTSPVQVAVAQAPQPAAHHVGAPRIRSVARRQATSRRSQRSILVRTAPAVRLFPHAVGALFGVGSFVAQRSGNVAPLVVGRASLLGAQWVREEFTASRLHDGPNAPYHWRPYDRVIDRERRSGLQILGLLDYSNTWNEGDHAMMPHRDIGRLSADFARYAYAVVRHFQGRVAAWEVWNEPNLPMFWRPAPNPDDYARLLDAAYRAIKRANPRARVVLAGMSRIDLPFLRRVMARTHSFDIISVHPYRDVPEPQLLAQIAALRVYHKPIWFSEIGWAAGDGCDLCTDQESQADYLVRFYALSAAAGVQRIFWYDLRDDVDNPVSPEAHFGLLQHDLAGKPAFVAYQLLSRLLRDAFFVRADALGQDGIYALRFRSRRGTLAILWNTGYSPLTVDVPWPFGSYYVLARDGTVLEKMRAWRGRASWQVEPGGAPVYLATVPWPPLTLPGALLRPPPPPRPPLHQRPVPRLPLRRPAAHRPLRTIPTRAPRKVPTHSLRPRPAPRQPADRGTAASSAPPPGTWTSAPEVHRGHRSPPRRRMPTPTPTPTELVTSTPSSSVADPTASPASWSSSRGSAPLTPTVPSPTATSTLAPTPSSTPSSPPSPVTTPAP